LEKLVTKPKICVYAISLNEEKFIERFSASCEGADMVLLADTGSTDRTVQLARYLGITCYEIAVRPWRFDTARNTALSLIPADYDICIALDVDEILLPGWRDLVEDAWREGTTRLQYRFDNGGGNVFDHQKIHARHGYTWHNLCHEMIQPDPRTQESYTVIEDILIEHHPDPDKSRGQYLPMLRSAITENPYSSRDRWYFARELFYTNDYTHAIREFEHYLGMPGAIWHHERSFALRHIGHCHMAQQQYAQALTAYRRAVDESRWIRDTWCDLGQACYELNLWQECFYAATQGLTITQREYVFTSTPVPWGWKLYDLAALAAHNLGMKEQAIQYGGMALEMNPTDARLLRNCEVYLA
jgi:tetratricopeptide (TPR) repeat protein